MRLFKSGIHKIGVGDVFIITKFHDKNIETHMNKFGIFVNYEMKCIFKNDRLIIVNINGRDVCIDGKIDVDIRKAPKSD